MKRTYIVTIEEVKQMSSATDLDICKANEFDCKSVEEIEKNQEKRLFKTLQILIDRFVDFTILLAKIICKIPIVGTFLLFFWDFTSSLCNRLYNVFIYITIFVFIAIVISGTIKINPNSALFTGLLSFFLTIFLLQYFTKYGNQIFWLLFSILMAELFYLFLERYLPRNTIIEVLRCFTYDNFGDTLTTMSVIISVVSILIKGKQRSKQNKQET